MNFAKKRLLIRERADKLGRLATHLLMNFDDDPDVAMALKFSWLLLRGPKSLLQKWGPTDLSVDVDMVENFIWRYQEKLSGTGRFELLEEEKLIVDLHNEESIAFSQQHRRSRLAGNVFELSSHHGSP